MRRRIEIGAQFCGQRAGRLDGGDATVLDQQVNGDEAFRTTCREVTVDQATRCAELAQGMARIRGRLEKRVGHRKFVMFPNWKLEPCQPARCVDIHR
jgi:hypothetical protein